MLAIRLLILAAVLLPLPSRADPVTEWTRLADQLGHGSANWRTLAIMHEAMHDAWNAAQPTYARWFAPSAGEPAGVPARPETAMAAAARRVLEWLHPDSVPAADQLLRTAYARIGESPAARAGLVLGDAIGDAAVARRREDGFERRHRFAKETGVGQWRPTPAEFETSGTTETRPFLFASAAENRGLPPPPAESDAFRREMLESMRLGGASSTERTEAETEAALFWAYQSSQRGFIALGAALLDAHPRPGGLAEHARIMSQLAAAMADSAILIWVEKERFERWRPVTAIRAMVPGAGQWRPMIDTPPHPEYPSGHAADCFAGAAVLGAAFPDLRGPVVYFAQSGRPADDEVGMGQHAQGRDEGGNTARRFPDLAAAAEECSDSRIWAGAHFRSADEESRRVAQEIARRAQAAVPQLQ